jgi:hypothetical protein
MRRLYFNSVTTNRITAFEGDYIKLLTAQSEAVSCFRSRSKGLITVNRLPLYIIILI